MIRDFIIALILAALLLVIFETLGILPFGDEPVETPWRVTAIMIVALIIGASAGVNWLQNFRKESNFAWPVLLTAFISAGVCAIEISYCLERNFETVYTLPVLLSGPISVGVILGATVRALR